MKIYYSKREMFRNVVIGAIIGAIFGAVILYVARKSDESANESERLISNENGFDKSDSLPNEEIAQSEKNDTENELKNQNEKIAELSRQYELLSASVNTVAKANIPYTIDEQQNIAVYEKCNEAVVNITTQEMAYNWFFEPMLQDGGSGTGSIIDKRGYVVTNVHVISNASKINISLADGSNYEGKVVGKDTESDIAVLKFDPAGKNLKTIDFGSSDNLKVGQKVIAIGNPFAVERTMTTGIISGLGRPIQESQHVIIRNMIQTDAAINPGNSGGPLLDSSGRMIGINTMIISNSGSSAGLGFAVPVSTAQRVVNDLIQFGKVNRGKIAITPVQMSADIARFINSSQGQSLGLSRVTTSSGILVSTVESGSNTEKSGLRGGDKQVRQRRGSAFNLGGDIIVQIDSIPVDTYADFMSALESKHPGDTISVRVQRNGGTETLRVKLD